jgi:hypothetical protein
MDNKAEAGCLMIVGLVAVVIGLGYIFGAGVGWLCFGGLVLLLGLLAI